MGLLKSFNAFLAEARRRRRWLVLCPAKLDAGAGERPVDVVNISTTGAMLYCDIPPQPQSRIRLIWTGRSDEATIVWVNRRRCGVKFDRPVPEAAIMSACGGDQLN